MVKFSLLRSNSQNRCAINPTYIIFIVAISVFLYVLFENYFYLYSHIPNIPFQDDWRYFRNDIELTFTQDFLTSGGNDTIFLSGKFLDYLLFRIFDLPQHIIQLVTFSSIIITITVASAALLLKLLPRTIALIAIGFFPLALVSPSYWGAQSIAYHQAIPLAALFLIFFTAASRLQSGGRLIALLLLSLFGSFAYISGATGIFAAGLVFTVWSLRFKRVTPGLFKSGLTVAVGALPAVLMNAHYFLILRNGSVHDGIQPSTPWTVEFWGFVTGLVGEAILPVVEGPTFALLSMISFGLWIASLLACLYIFVRKPEHLTEKQLLFVAFYTALSGAVLGYSMMAAFGRASLQAPNGGFFAAMDGARLRFHYWWIAILVPWLFAFGLNLRQFIQPDPSSQKPREIQFHLGMAVAVIIFIAWTAISTSRNRADFYETTAEARLQGIACISAGLAEERSDYVCPSIIVKDTFSEWVNNAREFGYQFARELPATSLVVSFHPADKIKSGFVRLENAILLQDGRIEAKTTDPMLIMSIAEHIRGATTVFEKLYIEVEYGAKATTTPQLFFKSENAEFSGENVVSSLLYKNGTGKFVAAFMINTNNISEIRFDPGFAKEIYDITRITLAII